MSSPFLSSKWSAFQLLGGMASHRKVLATPEIVYHYETKGFKFDVPKQVRHQREPSEVRLVETLSGSLYW